MKRLIFIVGLIFIFFSFISAEENVLTPLNYQFELNYFKGVINLVPETLKLENSPIIDLNNQPEKGYNLEIVSYSNEILFEYSFNFPLEILSDPGIECFNDSLEFDSSLCPGFNPYFVLDETSLFIAIPYKPTGKLINILDSEKELVLSMSIESFSDFCGDNICEIWEEGICEMDCGKGTGFPLNSNVFIILLIVVLVVIVIILFLNFRKKKTLQIMS